MDANLRNQFKKVLLAERQRVLNASNRSLEDIQINTDDLADETDQAVSELSQNLSLTLRDRERELLTSINAALQRIDSGTFGVCDSCGDDIEARRLQVRPMCTLCFSCQEEQEHKKKLFA